MIYVIDASVVLKWFLREQASDAADLLFEKFLSNKIELLAPDCLIQEVANTLWKQSILLKRLRPEDSLAILRDFQTLPLNLQPSTLLVNKALDLAIKFRHPVYDMLYCALAIENDCEFVRSDKVLVAKLAGPLPFIRLLTAV